MPAKGVFKINGHDYAHTSKPKPGWAGRVRIPTMRMQGVTLVT